jgi:hypothetical protein
MKIRKQVYELTNDDLQRYPVWEFASDEEREAGQDEATVRPYSDGPANPGAGKLVVRAKFIFADGTLTAGYLTPPIARNRDNLGIIQPQIITTNGKSHSGTEYVSYFRGSVEGLRFGNISHSLLH